MTEVAWRRELLRLLDMATLHADNLRQRCGQLDAPESNRAMVDRTLAVLADTKQKVIACRIPPPDGVATLGIGRGVTDFIADLDGPLARAVYAIEMHYATIPPPDPRWPQLADFTPVTIHQDGASSPAIADGQAVIKFKQHKVEQVGIWRSDDSGGTIDVPINDHGIAKEVWTRLIAQAPDSLRGEIAHGTAQIVLICPADIARLMVWPDDRVLNSPAVLTDAVQKAHRQFSAEWSAMYPETPPINYLFKHRLPTRWARIHSLPDAKRYADTDQEWTELLHRHNVVINHLVADHATIRVVIDCTDDAMLAQLQLTSELKDIGIFADSANETDFRLAVFETTWTMRSLDRLLMMIAQEQLRAFIMVAPPRPCVEPNCLIAPYDGGIDVILPNADRCAAFKLEFAPWVSLRADGL